MAGESWLYVFPVGPVFVGCGTDASLVIVRPFISLQHGCFHFDHHSARYQDLDPGVGTIIDGVAAAGSETPLTEWTQMDMGSLRVTVSRRPPDWGVADPSLSPFARAPAAPPAPAYPPTLVLPQSPRPYYPGPSAPLAPPVAEPADSEKSDEDVPPPPQRRRSSTARVVRRSRAARVKRFFARLFAWLSALAVGVVIVGAAGLLLQYRGLAWMPPWLVSRVPPWLASLFH